MVVNDSSFFFFLLLAFAQLRGRLWHVGLSCIVACPIHCTVKILTFLIFKFCKCFSILSWKALKWKLLKGHFVLKRSCSWSCLVSLFSSYSLVWFFSLILCSFFFLVSLVFPFSFRFSWSNIPAVFPLLPFLWQKLSMLDNVWHDLPDTVRQSWWIQWGCYGSCSLPCMLLFKVSECACDCCCGSHSSSLLFCFPFVFSSFFC